MKQIDNRQKILTKSRVERATFGKHDPRSAKEKARAPQPHAPKETPADAENKAETASPEKEVSLSETTQQPTPKVGRNDPCPCGSGKKYKKCCLK